MKYYHYTDAYGYEKIQESRKIKCSGLQGKDAILGKGVYLTTLAPNDENTKGRLEEIDFYFRDIVTSKIINN